MGRFWLDQPTFWAATAITSRPPSALTPGRPGEALLSWLAVPAWGFMSATSFSVSPMRGIVPALASTGLHLAWRGATTSRALPKRV